MDFINLSNGIQAIKDYQLENYRFIRLQSTACEQKRWGYIIENISDEFLLRLALGEKCTIFDYSNKRQIPRSIWQGLEWVKFALCFNWFCEIYQPIGRVSSSQNYFLSQYQRLPRRITTKLRYYRKYLKTQKLYVYAVTTKTSNDGNYIFYSKCLTKDKQG